MSLIRVRRNRKQNWIDVRRGLKPGKMILLLLVVVIVIWFLGVRF